MDANSDVSRASQIFSSVPPRLPLPDPLDLDELFGFSEALLKRTGSEVFRDVKRIDNNKVFINEIDSFCGKYLVQLLTKKETLKEPQDIVDVGPDYDKTQLKKIGKESLNAKGNTTASEQRDESKTRSKKEKSPKSPKNVKTKTSKKMSRAKPIEDVNENLEYIEDILLEESNKYDTSRLTVAEYYEWLELEPGSNRDEYLKEKLEKNKEEQNLVNNVSKIIQGVDLKTTFPKRHEVKQFYIMGTLKNNEVSEGNFHEGVSEIIEMSNNRTFYEQISTCGTIIYFINENHEKVDQALTFFNSLLNYLDDNPELVKLEQPLFILVSTFMCWASTMPLDPNNPDLPFTEKDYRKRIPHPNYQLHYELEQQVIQAKNYKKIDSIILTCGIPYGHEESVFNYLFETAYLCEDLPIYCSGSNLLPIIHVENMALVIKEIIHRKHEIKTPFLFVNDKLPYSLKELIEAISSGLGFGCYRTMPEAFSFLDAFVSQDIYDQTSVNVNLQSCYTLVNDEDTRWKNGFVDSIKNLIDEFIRAKNLTKPLIIFYAHEKIKMTNLPLLLSKYYNIPYLSVENVVIEYVVNCIKKLQRSSLDTDTKSEMIKYDETRDSNLGNDIEGNRECKDILNLDNSLELFKKLNIKELKDVGKLSDTQKVEILKEKFNENICRYHGFVLNEFPRTLHQAEMLFPLDEKENWEEHNLSTVFKFPDYIISLNESQVVENVQNIEIKEEDTNNEVRDEEYGTHGDHKLPEISNPESSIVEDNPEVKYFKKINDGCKIIKIKITKTDDEGTVLKTIITEIENTNETEQQPHSIKESTCLGVLKDSIVPEKDVPLTDKLNTEIKNELFNSEKEQEEIILSVRSYPVLNYLINFVYPTLTNALLQVSSQRPEDPLDFLAEYLFRENPHGRMFDPSQFKSKETYHNLKFPNIDSKTCQS